MSMTKVWEGHTCPPSPAWNENVRRCNGAVSMARSQLRAATVASVRCSMSQQLTLVLNFTLTQCIAMKTSSTVQSPRLALIEHVRAGDFRLA